MTTNSSITFGDNVRVNTVPATIEKGLAGLTGQVYGETTPSVTNVEVIGELKADYAINVFFEEKKASFWFAAELLEFLDHAPGTTVTLDGVPIKWSRQENGEWKETESKTYSKPWWKLW